MNRVCDDREFVRAVQVVEVADDVLERLVVHVPAERGEEGVEELKAELFFFVVAGEEDLATLVEMVN